MCASGRGGLSYYPSAWLFALGPKFLSDPEGQGKSLWLLFYLCFRLDCNYRLNCEDTDAVFFDIFLTSSMTK